MNEDTQEVPLPEGVARNPDATVTQEIPVPEPFPDVRLVTPVRVVLPSQEETVRVETVPAHLLGDPILTAPAPVPDSTPLYDQIHGRCERKKPAPPPRRMPTGDRLLVCMGVTALAMSVAVYGFTFEEWGAQPQATEKPSSAPVRIAPEPSGTEEPETPSKAPERRQKPVQEAVKVVMAPETYAPEPEQSIVIVPASPAEEETTTVVAPEPTTSATSRPSPPPAPSPTVTSPSPTPTSPSPSASQSTMPVLPPVTQTTEPTEDTSSG